MHAYAKQLGKFSTHSQKHLNVPPLTLKTQKRTDMLRKQTFALTLFLCFLALTANAAPIDVKEAQEIAENFFKNLPQARGKSMVPRLQPLQPLQRMRQAGDAPYYVFAPADGKGFVIVSGDDELPEVVGYSYDSPADGGTFPPALAAWLESFGHYIEDVRNGHANLPAARAASPGTCIHWSTTTIPASIASSPR